MKCQVSRYLMAILLFTVVLTLTVVPRDSRAQVRGDQARTLVKSQQATPIPDAKLAKLQSLDQNVVTDESDAEVDDADVTVDVDCPVAVIADEVQERGADSD